MEHTNDSFKQARKAMVDGQVRVNDVTRRSVQDALMTVKREAFLPDHLLSVAYAEIPVTIGSDRVLLTPVVLAKMLNAAGLEKTDKVLLIGGGSGYTAALLAELSYHVTVVEEAPYTDITKQALLNQNVGNVSVHTGALETGASVGSPYDVIIIEGATQIIPEALLKQLNPNTDSRLIAIYQQDNRSQASEIRLSNGQPSITPLFDAFTPVLPCFKKEISFSL